VHETYPALTPLVDADARYGSLAGLSLPVRVRARWRGRTWETSGGFLFTHRGYSGPAVLDASHLAVRSHSSAAPQESAALRVSWLGKDTDAWTRELADASGLVLNAVARTLPARLAECLLQAAGIPLDRRLAELRRSERQKLVEALTSFWLPWTGDEGYRKAEVTGGGVALDEVHPVTLESRHHRGLFLCGEMLDAFGPIGGHNFAWAWATGRAAGIAASRAAAQGAVTAP
jgi:predicted Rossmann fold flavoprotein